MGLRETLNEKPGITTGFTIGMIVVFVGLIWYSTRGGTPGGPSGSDGRKVYFTDDDGATTFADDALKVPPFDHNGKQAVRAHVFKAGGKQFVGHLERYTPEAKKKVEELYTNKRAMNDPTAMEPIMRLGFEVKAPGAKDWVKFSDPKARDITQAKPPGGGNADDLEEVGP